jgi:predicted transcriptional regulator/DNA-binding XRE family transcriptional regulator
MAKSAEKAGEGPKLGARVRSLRRREGLSQAQLAERLEISPSYLNLIENDRRPMPATVLLRLVQLFGIDLSTFGKEEEERLGADLFEVFSDPLFESHDIPANEVRDLANAAPSTARAILHVFRAYKSSRENLDDLAQRLAAGDDQAGTVPSLPSEEVSDFVQDAGNYFPALEEAAEALWRDAKLTRDELAAGLVRWLEGRLAVTVRTTRWENDRGVLRRFDRDSRVLSLTELLPTRSRKFQLAHQICLLEHGALLDRLVDTPRLTTNESRALARVALANYFAAAVMMPYAAFLAAAKEERYDVDVIGRRFRTGFEQVCHRLTTLRRPGSEGVAFHMIRLDVAGNISKRFSGSGIRFARYSGACPRWNIFSAFATPGMVRIQVSRMGSGDAFFCIARTVQKDSVGYHSIVPVHAIGLGCKLTVARELVYSDGMNLDDPGIATPVGVTCRTCDRHDCEQRALPSLRRPLQVDEHVRRLTVFAEGGKDG